MIFDNYFREEYGSNHNSEVEAYKILKRDFYFDVGDEYDSFYDIESVVELFKIFKKMSAPELLIEIKAFSKSIGRSGSIELTFNGIPFDYQKDDTKYSDDDILNKINTFLQKHNICKERYIDFETKHVCCIGFMSIETYEKMKDKNLILLVDGIDEQERFW